MRIPSTLTFALTITLAGPAGAQTATPDTPAAAPAAPPKMICVRGEAETGSHFGASKVCHTESEWAMIHNQNQRMLQQYDTQDMQMTPGSGR